jgi:hypothetical protein
MGRNIGKSVTDGFRWGNIIDEDGSMIKVQWNTGQTSDWMGYQNVKVIGGFSFGDEEEEEE